MNAALLLVAQYQIAQIIEDATHSPEWPQNLEETLIKIGAWLRKVAEDDNANPTPQ
jgi:HPt (histidine-containing phosphotransfer) domain-containing protein